MTMKCYSLALNCTLLLLLLLNCFDNERTVFGFAPLPTSSSSIKTMTWSAEMKSKLSKATTKLWMSSSGDDDDEDDPLAKKLMNIKLNSGYNSDDDDKDDEDDDDDDDDEDAGHYLDGLELTEDFMPVVEVMQDGKPIDPGVTDREVKEALRDPYTLIKVDPYANISQYLFHTFDYEYFPEDVNEYWSLDTGVPDEKLVQTMTPEERELNLSVIRRIQNNDLLLLRVRTDWPGLVDAQKELKDRQLDDPWYGVNQRLSEAVLWGRNEEAARLRKLADRLGGPPGDIKLDRDGVADAFEIFDYKNSDAALEEAIYKANLKRTKEESEKILRRYWIGRRKTERETEEGVANQKVKRDLDRRRRIEASVDDMIQKRETARKQRLQEAQERFGAVPVYEKPDLHAEMDTAMELLARSFRKSRGQATAEDLKEESSRLSPEERRDKLFGYSNDDELLNGKALVPGDEDVYRCRLGDTELLDHSTTSTGPLTVAIESTFNESLSDSLLRKYCFQYTVKITNNSTDERIQLVGRRFEVQVLGRSRKEVVEADTVTGTRPVLEPGDVLTYTSPVPLNCRPMVPTNMAARMSGIYRYVTLADGQTAATEDQVASQAKEANLGRFHFLYPPEERAYPLSAFDEGTDEAETDKEETPPKPKNEPYKPKLSSEEMLARMKARNEAIPGRGRPERKPGTLLTGKTQDDSSSAAKRGVANPSMSVDGDEDMKTGDFQTEPKESSDTTTEDIRIIVSSSFRPERSDPSTDKYCFAYNIRITNNSPNSIQLISRRFEIQSIGCAQKDVVQGPGITGRQPVLKPGESFEYKSTAPLTVTPMLDKTRVVARMRGEYNIAVLGPDKTTPASSKPINAKLGDFHFILPQGA